MTAKVWTKKQTQETIKALRTAGYDVKLISKGHYACDFEIDGVTQRIFAALVGANGYLVSYHACLFEGAE